MTDTTDKRLARILLVEDDVPVLDGMRDILELEGYIVMPATNGEEGLEAVEAHSDLPDLIISNVLMPKMDGFTFIQELHKKPQYQQIPFIIESANPNHKTEAVELGAAFFLTLPYDADAFREAVAAALTTT
jgi:CheY-like chemotaxis protein